MIADGKLEELLRDRYSSWDTGLGKEIEAGKHNFKVAGKRSCSKKATPIQTAADGRR